MPKLDLTLDELSGLKELAKQQGKQELLGRITEIEKVEKTKVQRATAKDAVENVCIDVINANLVSLKIDAELVKEIKMPFILDNEGHFTPFGFVFVDYHGETTLSPDILALIALAEKHEPPAAKKAVISFMYDAVGEETYTAGLKTSGFINTVMPVLNEFYSEKTGLAISPDTDLPENERATVTIQWRYDMKKTEKTVNGGELEITNEPGWARNVTFGKTTATKKKSGNGKRLSVPKPEGFTTWKAFGIDAGANKPDGKAGTIWNDAVEKYGIETHGKDWSYPSLLKAGNEETYMECYNKAVAEQPAA